MINFLHAIRVEFEAAMKHIESHLIKKKQTQGNVTDVDKQAAKDYVASQVLNAHEKAQKDFSNPDPKPEHVTAVKEKLNQEEAEKLTFKDAINAKKKAESETNGSPANSASQGAASNPSSSADDITERATESNTNTGVQESNPKK